MDRFDRIYKLHKILRAARRPVPRASLQAKLECSRATVSRIIAELRDFLGAPIEYDRKHNGYFYAEAQRKTYELPGLWFSASELYALLAAQRLLAEVQPGLLEREIAPLRQRIEQILAARELGSGEVARRVRLLHVASRHVPGEHFQAIAGALGERRRLAIRYHSRSRDAVTERDVSPQLLVHYRDNWYLDAWCHCKQDLRSFAVDRILAARALAEHALDIPDDALDAYFSGAYGIFAGRPEHIAALRFSAERARWVADEQWHRKQQTRLPDDASYERRMPLERSWSRWRSDVPVLRAYPNNPANRNVMMPHTK